MAPRLAVRARLLRIEDTRRDEPAFIDSLLSGGEATVRAAAVRTVGRVGAMAHLGLVRRLAADADPDVAADALFSLGLLKDSASVPLAGTSLRRGVAQAREAAWLLGELGERGRATIVAALGDPMLAPETRGALLLASARLRPVPAAAITPWLASRDSAIGWRAAYAIARGRSAEGTRALLAQNASPWSSVREQVARGAGRGVAGDSLGTIAQVALLRLVVDPEARVRINALRTLASYGANSRTPVLTALEDPDANVRVVAAQSLEFVLDTASAPWIAAFDRDTAFVIRRAIAGGAIKRGLALSGRAGWPTAGDWRRRVAAVELDAVGEAGGATVRLDRWSRDTDGRVRAAASGALATLVDSALVRRVVRERLRALLTDSDVGVRSASLEGLARGASSDDLAAALTSYNIARHDGDTDARFAFWKLADTVLAHRPVLADSVERWLAAMVRPVDPLERNAAARIGRFAAWRDSTGTARPLAWYESRIREAEFSPRTLRIVTERGTVDLTLFATEAPITVYNVVALAGRGYFDGQSFHRVVGNFVVQAGDPRGDGTGGPGYAIRDELNRRRYGRGTLGMALSGPNTGGSQFFIAHSPQPHLDGGYTVFGQLVEGADVLDRIVQGDRIVRVTVH